MAEKKKPLSQIEMERITEGVRDVILYQSQTDKSKTRGYAFVEYESHRAAALARRKLVPGRIFLLGQEIEKVDWAEPENEVDEEIMNKVTRYLVVLLNDSNSFHQFLLPGSSLVHPKPDGVHNRGADSKRLRGP